MKKHLLTSKRFCTYPRYKIRILLFVLCTCGLFATLQGQKTQKHKGALVICPAKFEDMHTQHGIPDFSPIFLSKNIEKTPTSNFEITFGPGAINNTEIQAAFQFALDIWATEIVSSVPIRVFVDFATLGQGVLASAGPTHNFSNFPGAPKPDVEYPAALANSIAGEILDPSEPYDLVVNLGNSIPFYLGTDGNTPAGQFDFVTIALHEAGHGLGFTTKRGFSTVTGSGTLRRGGEPSVYSLFMVDGNGNRLLDIEDPSTTLGDSFTGGNLFVDGTFAKAALGGELPEIYAPSNFAGGSSLAHWDEDAYPAGDPNSLMSPQVGRAESIFDIGAITRGHFKDMGWVLNDENAPQIISSPKSFSETTRVDSILVKEISISSISDKDVVVTLSAPNSSIISFLEEPTFKLSSAETKVLRIQFETSGITKGLYEEEITLSIEGDEETQSIPVSLRVIDGTEIPIIRINPESFSETVEQLSVLTKKLTIDNIGDENLNYTITLDSNESVPFSEQVATSIKNIRENGFQDITTSSLSDKKTVNEPFFGMENSPLKNLSTSLYATSFEEFELGNIHDQLGWTSRFDENWIISDENAFEGKQHFRSISDGLGDTRGSFILAFSPIFETTGDEPFTVFNAKVNIQGSGVTWEVIPATANPQTLATRLRFKPDGTIETLTQNGFVNVPAMTPSGYFDLKITVDKDDASFAIYFDESLVFQGQGSAVAIEQVILLSNMEVEGSTFDMDNFEITNGDKDAKILSVTPTTGVVPFLSSTEAIVKFDARNLAPGSYTASIHVNSDDNTNPSIVIPVDLTVIAPPTLVVDTDSINSAVDIMHDNPAISTTTFTISNTGENPLEFESVLGPIEFTPEITNDVNNIPEAVNDSYITLTPKTATIAPGASVEVVATFNGTTLINGTYKAPITLNSNDPVNPQATIATTFTVGGQQSFLELPEELLLFDSVFIGAKKEAGITLINSGLAAINISSIVSNNESFVIEEVAKTLDAGGTMTIPITFTPQILGNNNGIITLESDADNEKTVQIIVNGVGVAPPVAVLSPDTVITEVPIKSTTTSQIVLTNIGSAPLVYSFPEFAATQILENPDVLLNNTSYIDFGDFPKDKNAIDSRVGSEILYNIGKDITYGYTWIDSDEVGGPVYTYHDIAATGSNITELVGADGSQIVPIDFPFEFYGTTYQNIYVSANGFLSFDEPPSFSFINGQIPDVGQSNNLIAALWDDIEPQEEDGAVYYQNFDDRFIVQYSNVRRFLRDPSEKVSFQIVLYANGNIEFFYEDVSSAKFLDEATVGIENSDGTDGAQVAFNTSYLKDNLAIRFIKPRIAGGSFIKNVSTLSGVIPAGGSKNLTVTLDAGTLEPNTYIDKLTVSSNSPDSSNSATSFELTVFDVPEIIHLDLVNATTNEVITTIAEGSTIDLTNLKTDGFNIIANTNTMQPGSVVFDFNKTLKYRTENNAPYALGGDYDGDYQPLILQIGSNTITATPFTEANASGITGLPLTVNFDIVDNTLPSISNFVLINADTEEIIGNLHDGDTINTTLLGTKNLNVVAVAGIRAIDYVVFALNDDANFRTEKNIPYSLAGDLGTDFRGIQFPLGENTLVATPYTSAPKTSGAPLTVTFTVTDTSPITNALSIKSVVPNPVQTIANFVVSNPKGGSLEAYMVNLLGNTVIPPFDFTTDANGTMSIDMSYIQQGAYILIVKNNFGETVQAQIVK